jgi:hypothetical protein
VFRSLKRQWRNFKRARPGRRFQGRYNAGRKARKGGSWRLKFERFFRVLAALVLLVVGVIFVFTPGPGLLFFFIAGGLLSTESILVARFLDWTEIRSRAGWAWTLRHWKRLHLSGKIALGVVALFGVISCGYVMYRLAAR